MTLFCHPGYFDAGLADVDPEIHAALAAEEDRQRSGVELIASENIVSRATLEALGTAMVNKTVEGYPGKRYYGGTEHADVIEQMAIDRAKALFGCAYANVQPHSGSQANLAVFLAFLEPGDTVLSMSLSESGSTSSTMGFAKTTALSTWIKSKPWLRNIGLNLSSAVVPRIHGASTSRRSGL